MSMTWILEIDRVGVALGEFIHPREGGKVVFISVEVQLLFKGGVPLVEELPALGVADNSKGGGLVSKGLVRLGHVGAHRLGGSTKLVREGDEACVEGVRGPGAEVGGVVREECKDNEGRGGAVLCAGKAPPEELGGERVVLPRGDKDMVAGPDIFVPEAGSSKSQVRGHGGEVLGRQGVVRQGCGVGFSPVIGEREERVDQGIRGPGTKGVLVEAFAGSDALEDSLV